MESSSFRGAGPGRGRLRRTVMENDKAGRRDLYRKLRLPEDASVKKGLT
jgi:hypothetical protein